MKKKELVMLLSENSSYIVRAGEGKFHTSDGVIDLRELLKKNFGNIIKTHIGKKFLIVKPCLKDLMDKGLKRGAQVVLPKDVSLILAYTGVSPDSLVVDCGSGSGFMCIFLAHYLCKGKVITYEKNEKFAKIVKENIKFVGLKNILLKEKDVTKGIDEKDVDLVTVDMQNPEKVVKHAYKALKHGGFLAVYSPTAEELIRVNKEIKKFGFCNLKVVENIVREWQVEYTTRPKTIGLMHTGWITFARKVK